MDTPTAVPPVGTTAVKEDSTTAIVAYLTLIGFIAAVIIHGSKKTRLGAFHLRQALGLMLTSIVMIPVNMLLAFIPILGWIAVLCVWIGLLVCWVMGLIGAIKGERSPV